MNPKQIQKPPIDDFNGYYQFLNNDYPTWVQFQGINFPNVTTAFQAARTNNNQIRKQISLIENYQQFKQVVSKIKNPQNWFTLRYKVMQKIIRDKFKRNRQIANKLAATEQRKLINCYKNSGQNQFYWGTVKINLQNGKCDYKGTNSLGKILETVRSDIIKQQDTQKWVTFQNLQQDQQLIPEIYLTVFKDNQPIDKLILEKRNYFLFGSHPKCQFKLQHPSISKFHAAIFFSQLQVLIVDTNSTHGTFIIRNNKTQKIKLESLQKINLQNGDTILFGMSSRVYKCTINLQKMQKVLKMKQQEIQKNVKKLNQVNYINEGMTSQQIKSKIGYKIYEALHVKNINKDYSYNDIKQLFKKYGAVQKVRLIQNYKTSKFQGQVIICYDNKKNKIQEIIKQIKKADDKQIMKFQINLIDKYDMQKILEQNKQQNDLQRRKDNNRDKYKQHKYEKYNQSKRQKRSRSRSKERKQKHKHSDKYSKH